jgi:hypothetical protein
MRALLLLSALLVLSLLPPPAAASTTCGGALSGTASCYFVCDLPTARVAISGSHVTGASVSLLVKAECGNVFGGVFYPAYTVATCAATGYALQSCTAAGPHALYPVGLVGRCTASETGTSAASYACSTP